MRSRALAAALGGLWRAACTAPPDMTRGMASGPYEGPLLPPDGTLAVDAPPSAERPAALNLRANPRPASAAVLAEGAALYRVYCTICHGADGGGDSLLAEYLPRLPDLRSPVVARRPDGRLYGVILRGGFRMPAYGDALSEAERWAVVHHLRTLGGGDGQ
ncbi:MAG: cytochrome c [Acidobacteria bacterium]|nr:cytochrome c [Acidobacteriota bacterium]